MLLETPKLDTPRAGAAATSIRSTDEPGVLRRLLSVAEDVGLEAIDAWRRAARHPGRPALRQVCARNWSRGPSPLGRDLRQQQAAPRPCSTTRPWRPIDDRVGIERIDRFERSEHRDFDVEVVRAPTGATGANRGSSRAALDGARAPPPLPAAAGTRACPMQPRSCAVPLQRDEGAGGLGQIRSPAVAGARRAGHARAMHRRARELDESRAAAHQ